MISAALSVAGALRASLLRASRRVLGLDFDGTLAPFRPRRMEVTPYPGVVPMLEKIHAQGDLLAFFSGRPVAEVRHLLKPLGDRCPIFGCHGGEEGWPGEEPFLLPLPEQTQEGLAVAEAMFRERWKHKGFTLPCPLERKHGTLALHTRNYRLPEQDFSVEIWASVARETGLQILPFDGGWELRHRAFNKGKALERYLASLPPPEPPSDFVAYLGDDLTDEDAFAFLARRGLGILVRSRWRPTQASAWCVPPEEVLQFLSLWEK
ncbi:MAG TPA: trehalose-phosphatase [Synergistaceae bacterium]|mgnify:CR=1 FL=1|nr:trehalose-phosphatase [Synergistaceae bacterium]HQF90514.1 trehalose-phosphatase [Synergistaceae bacterium]HQH77508.1 trehalose-phosphatase [Synergistaceae bacterium]HQK24773.1 trehalose-phosphatase [Synergistaceae bacterium]